MMVSVRAPLSVGLDLEERSLVRTSIRICSRRVALGELGLRLGDRLALGVELGVELGARVDRLGPLTRHIRLGLGLLLRLIVALSRHGQCVIQIGRSIHERRTRRAGLEERIGVG